MDEDLDRQDSNPNQTSRNMKSYDLRNMEDNMNFYNLKKSPKFEQKPSNYDHYMAITQLIDAALSSHTEERIDEMKYIDSFTQQVRDLEEDNQICTNPGDTMGKTLNLVDWLSYDSPEEVEMDAELTDAVNKNRAKLQAANDYTEMKLGNNHLWERRITRDRQNGFINKLRKIVNLD